MIKLYQNVIKINIESSLKMTTARKLSAIRQLSLQCDTTKFNKKILKKQHSEDIPDDKINLLKENNGENQNIVRISMSAKVDNGKNDRPTVKLAWSENIQKSLDEDLFKKDEGVVAKKCKEMRRPLKKQTSLDKDSILCNNRQNLAERLRQAWEDKDKGNKQNLDIFLTSPQQQKHDDKDDYYKNNNNNYEYDDNDKVSIEKTNLKPKIIEPLNKQVLDENNLKNIFHKQIRRNNFRNRSTTIDFPYTPSRSIDKVRENTIVVVPIIDNETPNTRNEEQQQKNHHENQNQVLTKNEIDQPMNIIIRPSTASTASSRREMFQKRTNSAFHEVIKKDIQIRPPLVRASSVPSKSTNHKNKFPVSKRRAKSSIHNKKRDQNDQLSLRNDDDKESVTSDKGTKKKFMQRCISSITAGTEIETMVSLVSPDGSDNEEIVDKEKDNEKLNGTNANNNVQSPAKTNLVKKEEMVESKNFSLRKTVKSVSFQQSSIHAVRSFSASFPARRGSVAAAFMIGNNNVQKDKTNHSNSQPQLISSTSFDDNNRDRGPKRRLLRTKSVPLAIDPPIAPNNTLEDIVESKSDENISLTVNVKKSVIIENNQSSNLSNKDENSTTETSSVNGTVQPDFVNDKEKQCWEMFCKMSDKGVNITFDTLLRGMLTPTEYRMRKRTEVQPEEIVETNNDTNNTISSVKK